MLTIVIALDTIKIKYIKVLELAVHFFLRLTVKISKI